MVGNVKSNNIMLLASALHQHKTGYWQVSGRDRLHH